LRNVLRQYASEATGGSAVGPRRFGPAYTAGADLFGVMSDLGAGGTGEASAGQDLSRLVGQPMDVAAQEISDALAPDGADRDQVRVAMQEAIAEKLGDEGIFDPTQIGMDQITALMVEFFALILFQQISDAAGEASKRAPNVTRSTSTENDLLELVRAAMDKHLGPRLAAGLRGLSRDEIRTLEKDALRDIWRMWESPE
jgi:hypothetical protein